MPTPLPSGHPIKRDTLQSKFLPSIAHYLSNGTILADEYEAVCKDIHQTTVQNAILNQPLNNVLQDQPPTIDPVEKTLPRAHRSALAQLRSGYCKALNTFQNRLDPSVDPSCPTCGSGEPHTTNHLFDCPAYPTGLVVRDLWLRPVSVASFISSLPFFYYLPTLHTPPPEPPPTGPAL